MLQLTGQASLVEEAAQHRRIVAVTRQNDLDGDVAADLGIVAAQNGPHAAVGDFLLDLVAASQRRRELVHDPHRVSGRRQLGLVLSSGERRRIARRERGGFRSVGRVEETLPRCEGVELLRDGDGEMGTIGTQMLGRDDAALAAQRLPALNETADAWIRVHGCCPWAGER